MTSIRRLAGCMSLALLAFATADAAMRSADVAVEVVGLSVKAELPEDRAEGMFHQGGTEITLLAGVDSGAILGLDESGVELRRFVDDKGTDLTPESGFGAVPWLGSFPKTSDDGRAILFSIVSDQVPAAGARTIELDATVGLLVGTTPVESDVKDVEVAVGTELKLGDVPVRISAIGTGFDGRPSVTFESKQPFDTLQSLSLLSADGTATPLDRGGSSSMGFGDDYTYTVDYTLPEGSERVSLRVAYYSRVETVPLNVNFKLGVGLN